MSKYKILSFILLGSFLALSVQSILTEKIHASDFVTSTESNIKEQTLPNFINASNHVIKAVVHIKSKYRSNEIYGYYDPFYGKRFFNRPKENIASGSGVIISDNG